MKKLYIPAALLMASTAAHAGNSISFEIDGHKVRIEVPRNCDQLSCIQISAPGLSGADFKGFKIQALRRRRRCRRSHGSASARPRHRPRFRRRRRKPAAPRRPPPHPPPRRLPRPRRRQPSAVDHAVGSSRAAPVAPQPAPVAAAPVAAPSDAAWRLGDRREQGQRSHRAVRPKPLRLCRQDRRENPHQHEAVGCEMGRPIHDPDSGSNYNSTIAMKGPNTLRVQGCAFGGMFCGGQTWKRVS